MKGSASVFSVVVLLAAAGPALAASKQLSATDASAASAGSTASPLPAASPVPAGSPVTAASAAAPASGASTPTEEKSPPVSPEILRGIAALAGGGIKPEDVRPTPVPGIFELRRGADIIYMSQDGRYVFTGSLYRVEGRANLTEAHKSELRKKLIDAVPESDMVVFAPPSPKYMVTVFTDVDCPYCQAFHKQIADYNRLGIKVRYVFFPRSGPNTPSWHKAEQVWCSTDRKAALTDSKLGKPLQAKVCPNTPVGLEYQLGKDIGLEGTPGVVASDGTVIGGYLPPDQLLDELKQLGQ
ncbi:MAG TPA: DsbC family protein [Steroidobacteraceae bacterium]|jgi:thiol:disulfide interchange protein DsbC|nr:DsbC family protein [Steroidobacteraceae bacterium]